jgi:hypothetical protein
VIEKGGGGVVEGVEGVVGSSKIGSSRGRELKLAERTGSVGCRVLNRVKGIWFVGGSDADGTGRQQHIDLQQFEQGMAVE